MKRLDVGNVEFQEELLQAVAYAPERDGEVEQVVRKILEEVRMGADKKLLEYTQKFDGYSGDVAGLKVELPRLKEAYDACSGELKDALNMAADRIRAYHERQRPEDEQFEDALGNMLGWRWTPVDRAGLYVPGGTAVYPSSVLMNAIPAKAAGVKDVVMVVPAPGGELNPIVLAAAYVAGIEEVYTIGGAQAIAALAYGTETIQKADVIVGPGNKYVAAAKRLVFGTVGIDAIAGPSEIVVIADSSANPAWIAADLLSQAEHDVAARSIFIATDTALADAVEAEVSTQLEGLSRKEIAQTSWDMNGLIITCESLQQAAEISNQIAPEHLELMVEDPQTLCEQITHAGAIFLGGYTPEPMGDYIAGPSHVLPTSGAARFSSGISVFTFLKRSSLISCTQQGFSALADATEALAESEGLTAHARSVTVRKN